MTRTMTKLATAALLVLAMGCISADDPKKRTKQGAAIGAASGAAVGAVIGHQNDEKGEGAVIGAAVGAAIGAAVGHRMDKQQAELERIEGVEVTRPAEDRIDLTIRNDILFDIDSAVLHAGAQTTLHDLARVLADYPDTRILVEGHTDSTGSESYNQRLSERRAESVTRYLVSRGVHPAQLDSIGFGLTVPRASNATAEGRQLNRRVELRIRATG
jgi:outer membrane protein OmpA-like peptidoglycan-associated protein